MWAISQEDPDQQRKALNKLAKAKPVKKGSPRFLQGLQVIALHDPDPQVRCAALSTLSATPDRDLLAEVSLKLVGDKDPRVRQDACVMLDKMLEAGSLPAGVGHVVRESLMSRLVNDDSTDVQIAACKGLRHFRTLEVVQTLVTALAEVDFSVAYHAEKALTELTGQRFECDDRLWRRWLDEVEDPFAGRSEGQTSAEESHTGKPERNTG